MNDNIIYYGEKQCSAIIKSTSKQCPNFAYYSVKNTSSLPPFFVCGQHSKKDKDRVELPRNPDPNAKNVERYNKARDVSKVNRQTLTRGSVVCTNLPMMKSPTYIDGYLNVYPNFKHQNRKDGFGCSSLSPMSLGPVEHGMPNIPIAVNIENYHQFAKFWSFEIDPETGLPTEEYHKKRCDGYSDSVPHRHKYAREILIKYCDNINIPKYSLYFDKKGKPHKYTYIQCRYFYCHWYEILAKKTEDFKTLQEMINNGWNLNISGYDGRKITPTVRGLFEAYLDKTRPFGHELVLMSLLVITNPKKYPWNIYYNCKKEIYRDVI